MLPHFVFLAKDPCSPNPCHHSGHCLAHGENDFECQCARGFTGVKCESKPMIVEEDYWLIVIPGVEAVKRN